MMAQVAQRFIEKVRDRSVVIGVGGFDAVLITTDHDHDAVVVAHAKRVWIPATPAPRHGLAGATIFKA